MDDAERRGQPLSIAGRQLPWQSEVAAPLPADGGFTPQEHWAWARIIRGLRADMRYFPVNDAEKQRRGDDGDDDGGGSDPEKPETWPAHRRLSAQFMHTILFCEPWASARARPFVRIACGRFPEELDWQNEQTNGELSFDKCRFDSQLNWISLRIGRFLHLNGSHVEGIFYGDSLVIDGTLFCGDGFSAKREFRLLGARIGGDMDFGGATLEGALSAAGVACEGYCYLREMKKLVSAGMQGASIGHDLQISKSAIEGDLDFTNAEIKGELNLAQYEGDEPVWGEKARLVLRNASAGALAGGLNAFRRGAKRKDFVRCDLAGFTYGRIGGLGAGKSTSTLATAGAGELWAWLKRCRPADHFDPAPYLALARGLRDAGRKERAADIRMALGDYEFVARGTPWQQRVLLALSSLFIGYGERNHRALMWFVVLVLAGAEIGYWQDLVWAPAATPQGWTDSQAWLDWIGYAFGDAIPLLTFDEAHKTFLVDRFCGERIADVCTYGVPTGVTAFFYGVKVVGFIILSYLAAGLSGLAQRRD
jgi:hypothetical protein